jgi:hypothetical protein
MFQLNKINRNSLLKLQYIVICLKVASLKEKMIFFNIVKIGRITNQDNVVNLNQLHTLPNTIIPRNLVNFSQLHTLPITIIPRN